MAEGSSSGNKDDNERLKKLMKTATGCDNVDEVRKKTHAVARPVDSAKEFLRDMEYEENDGVNQNAGDKPKIVAPSPKDDEVLKTVSLSGPEPKPPAPRTVTHPPSAQSMASSDDKSEAADQTSNLIDSSTPQQQSLSSEDKDLNLTSKLPSTTVTTESRDSDLDYKWISMIYAIGSLLSLVFYLLEKYGSRPQRSIVANLNDVYIVFLPYIPCLIWTFLRLNQWRKVSVPAIDPAKKEQ